MRKSNNVNPNKQTQMKKILFSLTASLIMVTGCAQSNPKNKDKSKTKMELKTEIDSVSYAIGLSVAQNLKSQGFEDLNTEAFMVAMTGTYNNEDPKLNPEELDLIIRNYMTKKSERDLAVNKEKGEKFLKENATKSGVKVTASGLQYKVITEGTGAKPTAENEVEVHYHGTLIDGTVFDSSVDRGETISFPLNRVIPGWTEGVQLMSVGSKYIFYIPSELAYGERGSGQIGPNEALIFEVELFGIK
jgi:FKBP-type peptidyl-prolyl cis-trans isomerase FklB